ncbi:YHS domain-containing protein [Rhodophyticola sp. CCM32]|uniref:YHS domain-containing (seleno)protein n=1 Tax=Rhodophyticola sp. CCM32 TaxID=2916397 RepID=UPI00107FCC8D|nr:YHS domain-containing (seleno)protein [Rhodophyticola sp. CCM32]QBY01243.1 YHS domain-containing protein [Rhodophyticola sp. CCM32]
MLTRRNTLRLFAATPLIGLAAFTSPALAAEPETYAEGGVAIDGSDAVAYFTEHGPVPGSPDHSFDWRGARWQFSSAANRDLFAAEPERYAPAFGGYCAFAASRGYLAPTMPEAWSIYEDRLYLNANLRARELWLAELPSVIAAGEANWPGILG